MTFASKLVFSELLFCRAYKKYPEPNIANMTSVLSCSKSVNRGLHVIYLCFMIFVGPIKEDCCVFPYIYQDVEYHNCIDKDHTTFWCATEVDSDGKFKEWKQCDEACDEGK